MNTMVIMRGVPGSGKSTKAKELAMIHNAIICSADMFMVNSIGEYAFNPAKLSICHDSCKVMAELVCSAGWPMIIIDNTHTQLWEMNFYVRLAMRRGYKVEIVECQGNFGNIHGVPQEKVAIMSNRFQHGTLEDIMNATPHVVTHAVPLKREERFVVRDVLDAQIAELLARPMSCIQKKAMIKHRLLWAEYGIRRAYIAKYGFVLFGTEIANRLRPYGRILAIGAGTGYLEAFLASEGVDIIATDIQKAWESGYDMRHTHGNVHIIDGESAMDRYGYDAIMMSWPHGWELPMLEKLPSGKKLIMIGEGMDGCCATDDSWSYIYDNFNEVDTDYDTVVSFDGLHDHLSIWEKK